MRMFLTTAGSGVAALLRRARAADKICGNAHLLILSLSPTSHTLLPKNSRFSHFPLIFLFLQPA